jgi:hypothetical protein
LTIPIEFAKLGLPGSRNLQQLRSKLCGICRRNAKCGRKDARFSAAARAVWIQAIIAQLPDVNDCAFSIGQQHKVRLQAAHTS